MMMAPLRGPDPGRLLAAALLARLPVETRLCAQDGMPWASATFVGTRHRLRLSCPDTESAMHFATTVSDAEFALRGHLLADIAARMEGDDLLIDALTLVLA